MRHEFRASILEINDQVGVFTLNRPKAFNAINPDLRDDFHDMMAQIRNNKSISALVLTGAGKGFCSGGDIGDMDNANNRDPEFKRRKVLNLHTFMESFYNLEIPTIAAINGAAFGAGFSLALSCDFVLASSKATFCASFQRLGVVPDLGLLYFLPRLIGQGKAKELLMTARAVKVEEALELGFVHSSYSPDELLSSAIKMASKFAHASRVGMGLTKNIINQSLDLNYRAAAELEANGQGICAASPYHHQAVARFLNKEPITFDWDNL